jgi:hypothetical protein
VCGASIQTRRRLEGYVVAVRTLGAEAKLVAAEGAALFGVSGRQVATIPPGELVDILGERGPYSIIHWDGRNGYALTSELTSSEPPPEPAVEEIREDKGLRVITSRRRFNLPWRRVAA